TGGLAAACFVKAFGITFLAMPRSTKAKEALEVGFSMKAGMFFLSTLTIVFGLAAAVIFKILVRVAQSVVAKELPAINFTLNNFTLNIQEGNFVYLSVPSIALALAIVILTATIFIYRKKGKVKKYNTWDCGYYKITARNEYTATAFSKPFRIAFSFFLKPYRKTEKIRKSFYHIKSFKYGTFTTSVFKDYIYMPILAFTFGSGRLMRRIQPGSIHLYIAYIFVTIVALIIFMKAF
ncbi:MAG: formate hydrogenlyase, partial [Candidatus Omnitrophota bacterium]